MQKSGTSGTIPEEIPSPGKLYKVTPGNRGLVYFRDVRQEPRINHPCKLAAPRPTSTVRPL